MRSESILILFLLLFTLELTWEQLLLFLNLRQSLHARTAAPESALEIWGPGDYQKALEYSRSKSRLAVVSSIAGSAHKDENSSLPETFL